MTMDIRKVFEYALQREYEGKAFFVDERRRLAKCCSSRSV